MKTHEIHKRKGRLIVSDELLKSMSENDLKQLYSNVFPMNIELKGFYKHVIYAVSNHFDVVEEGCFIPEYTVELITDEEGNSKFHKVNKIEN